MIYTITLNPAIDYVVELDALEAGSINRTASENIFFGGKGINVSLVLSALGVESTALGFIAGFTGLAIEDGIRQAGVNTDFVHVEEGFTRINVKIKASSETEINGRGPNASDHHIEALFEKLSGIKDGDAVIIAGSVPSTLPDDIYESILELLKDKDISVVVDSTKKLLLNSLKYRPFLVKPNIHELEDLFEAEIKSHEDIVSYAARLQSMGARNVLVSMAKDGSILLDEKGCSSFIAAPKGEAVNSVGAGDSMVAGFLAGYISSKDYSYAHKLGTAAGAATAFSKGLATKGDIEQIFSKL